MTFTPSDFALSIFRKRYALHEEETWQQAAERVANHVASAEQGSNIPKYNAAFSELLASNLFMPGGRIWYGAGRPKGQLLNCFVIPTSDSREGWGKTVSDMIVISGTGGGVGINGDPIRPRGTPISGSGGTATGSVSLFKVINAAGEVIKGGGGRRCALMLCLGLDHPDIQEFLDVKLDLKELNNANISVVFNENPEEFFKCVKKNKDLPLLHRGRQVGAFPAKTLWDKIIQNALKNGEPGILNGYYANKMSSVSYEYPLISTNPCGEIWLPAYGCCDLGALVLPRFLKEGKVDYGLLNSTISLAVRFLDDVLTVNNYPLPEIKETCNNERRIGLGIMGLSTMLLQMGIKYTSPEALEFVNKLMNYIKNSAYEASISLAQEKGPFAVYKKEEYLKTGFVKTLKPSLRSKIEKNGIRNCALLTIAPTGTTSICCDVDSGIEPAFGPAWLRRFYDGDQLKEEVVVHPLFKEKYLKGQDVSHFESAYNIKMRDHLEMQRICQRHIDNAVSKTINLPPGTSAEELSELYMEFLPELKGVTVYPEGSRENQPITPLSYEEALKHLDSEATGALGQDNCKDGVCEI